MSNDVYPILPGLDFGLTRSVVPPPVTIVTTPSQREYRARAAGPEGEVVASQINLATFYDSGPQAWLERANQYEQIETNEWK